MGAVLAVIVILVILGIIAVGRSLKVVQQYEKGKLICLCSKNNEEDAPGEIPASFDLWASIKILCH